MIDYNNVYYRLSLFSLISAVLAIFVRETLEDKHEVTTQGSTEKAKSSDMNLEKWHSNSGFDVDQAVWLYIFNYMFPNEIAQLINNITNTI